MSECVFCRIVSGQAEGDIIYQDEEITAFRDINPQAPQHILIVPNHHISSLNHAREGDAPLLGQMVILARELALREGLAERGYRLVLNCGPEAGQSIYHLHLHLLGGRPLGWPPG